MKKISSSFCLVFLLTLFSAAALAAQEPAPRRIGLIVAQPPRVPMKIESDFVAEIAQELDAADPSFEIQTLNPSADDDGRFVSRAGEPVELDEFDALWLYQGDEIVDPETIFSEAQRAEIKRFIESRPNRGVLLTGGAVAAFGSLGFGTVDAAPVAFGEDREQAGLVPVAPSAAAFHGVEPDRGTLWITNAAFPAFERFGVSGDENVRTLATTPGGPANPLLVGVSTDESGVVRVKATAFGWRVSPLFDRAAPFFKTNLKTLFANMLRQTGAPISDADFVAPPFVLPDFAALERALAYLTETFGADEYPGGSEYLRRFAELRERVKTVADADAAAALNADFAALQKEALLANPELDFDELLTIRRDPDKLGLPQNYNSNSVLPPTGYRNELCRLNLRTGETTVVYKPKNDEFVGDLQLYYDASKVMFSAPDVAADNRWRLWELPLNADGSAAGEPVETPLIDDPDVDNYDACYLPDDRIVFCSTACQTGVPCIDGSGHVCNLYIKEKDGSIRQLTLEQDHDWRPTVMNNGRVMYLRWEYVDLPHAFSRILFHMNPDGTNQSELYGSGSYWPNAIFYARPIPGSSTKFVGIVGGHHELERRGDLVIFDAAVGRREADGAIQRIPGYGKKVQPTAIDLPIGQTWPQFLHPYPISENYFVVSCKRSPDSPWEICLVDVFDNIVTLANEPENALLEPVPLRETERQPIVPDRVQPGNPEADVFIADIYAGEGLKGVPRGEVKSLRIFSYEFSYQGMGAEPHSVGLDGPWDPRRVIGTVPVYDDGSASFKIPAYTPVAFQPLDKDGKAIQLMRSWITALPGESVSCVGCHEKQNETSPTAARTTGAQSKPLPITPFYGPTRGFGFEREIQPILDKYCVECHSPESAKVAALIADGTIAPERADAARNLADLRKSEPKPVVENGNYIAQNSPFSNAYYQLRRFVRTQTKESQMAVHRPFEFYADTDALVQLLQNGHFGVELDPESWAKLTTWIDFNAPYYSNWGEIRNKGIPEVVERQWSRREELRRLYAAGAAALDDDPTVPIEGRTIEDFGDRVRFSVEKTPDSAESTWRRDAGADASTAEKSPYLVELADGVSLEMTPIPGTNFSAATFEITNAQFKLFKPDFDAGIEYADFIQFSPGEIGWLLSRKNQPVARVTWNDANEFCAWLSEKTGKKFRLPTESELRFAASGGATTPFWFGDAAVDYSPFENLADSTLAKIDPFGWADRPATLPAYRPVDWNCDDRSRVSAPVGSYAPNPFGLYDAQGNVSEWTLSEIVQKKEIVGADGTTKSVDETPKKVVFGGSWRLTAAKSTLDSTRAFPAYFNVYDVGFRPICVEEER